MRVGPLHFAGLFEGRTDLDQRALAHAGTVLRRGLPLPAAFEQLGPEGEEPTLRRLGRMDAAAIFVEEMALLAPGLAETDDILRAIDILRFKPLRRQAQKTGRFGHVGFGQIDIAFDFTTVCATLLAGKAEGRGVFRLHL